MSLTKKNLIKKAIEEKKIVIFDNLIYENQQKQKFYTYEEAQKYANNLKLAGLTNWRLPTKKELHKIANIKLYGTYDNNYNWKKWFDKNKHKALRNYFDFKVFIKNEFIKNVPEGQIVCYWALEEINSTHSWTVNFSTGTDGSTIKSNYAFITVLCVHNLEK